jgi:hypothetical protein
LFSPALAEGLPGLAGLGLPRLYPAGWSGWIADDANPVASGPDDLDEVIDLDHGDEDRDA